MVNCNPETVSTDYGISDRLFRAGDIGRCAGYCRKAKGVIVQYGGQTPLKFACELEANGAIIGTSPDAIDRAEDRERFRRY